MGIEMEVSSRRKTDDRYFGPYEIDHRNQCRAYILKELDGAPFRHNPTTAFRRLPNITRNHWFMRENEEEDPGSDSDSDEDKSSDDEE
jgi:hypothetical protein